MTLNPYVQLAIVFTAGVVGWTINGWRYEAEINEMVNNHTQAKIQAEQNARAQEVRIRNEYKAAIDKGVKRETQLAKDADSARNESERLRLNIAGFRRQLPKLDLAACNERADTFAELLDYCQAEYTKLGKSADQLMSDRQTCLDAWPKPPSGQ